MFICRNCQQSVYLFVCLSLWLQDLSIQIHMDVFVQNYKSLLLQNCYSCCVWLSPARWYGYLRNMRTVEIISSAVLNASVISQPWVIGSVSVINAIFNSHCNITNYNVLPMCVCKHTHITELFRLKLQQGEGGYHLPSLNMLIVQHLSV